MQNQESRVFQRNPIGNFKQNLTPFFFFLILIFFFFVLTKKEILKNALIIKLFLNLRPESRKGNTLGLLLVCLGM